MSFTKTEALSNGVEDRATRAVQPDQPNRGDAIY